MKVWDVVIVGGGAIGAAAAFFIKKKNPRAEVLLLERREGFGRGATGSWGSLIRVFSVRPGISEKATQGLPYFLRFEELVGKACGFVQTGCLYFFKEKHHAEVQPALDRLKPIMKTEMHVITAEEGRIRFPHFQWLDGDFAVYEPQAGYACPWSTTDAWISQAEGLESRLNTGVKQLRTKDNLVTSVVTDEGESIEARRVLVAGGPWTSELVGELGVTIAAAPQALQVNRFQFRSHIDQLPTFLDYETMSFARPAGQGTVYGGSLIECKTKLNTFRQPLCLSEASEAKKRLSTRLKALRTSELAGGIRALEMYASNFVPVLGFDAKFPNLYLATGWSCTGFTLAPVYGEKIAGDLVGSLQ